MSAKEIQATLRANGDKAIAEHSQRFFKTGKGEYGEGDKFLGLLVPVLRAQVKKYKQISLSEILKLLKSKYHEERLLAIFLLVDKFKHGDEDSKTAIYSAYLKNTKYINSWDIIDGSAYKIVGPYLQNRHRKILYELADSRSLWERRIAIMSTFHFIRQNDFTETLKLSKILLKDDEDLIHKAVGWMLREVGNRDKIVEEIFLKIHYKNMPRTMLRYAIEKFPEALRQDYLKGRL